MAGLTINKLTKVFRNGHIALKDISFDVYSNELFVILGPSGSGKTTLLRIIAGLEKASSGNISIDDKSVNELAPKNRGVGMVFQNYALLPHMSIFDNIAFPLKMQKIKKSEIKEEVDYVSNLLKIDTLLKRKPFELSGGQRQRVAIAREIARKPKIFLFDEPLSNLDIILRRSMREEIKKLKNQIKATILYVTHDHKEAEYLGDRICLLNNGTVQQIGAFKDLCDNPANEFVKVFMNAGR